MAMAMAPSDRTEMPSGSTSHGQCTCPSAMHTTSPQFWIQQPARRAGSGVLGAEHPRKDESGTAPDSATSEECEKLSGSKSESPPSVVLHKLSSWSFSQPPVPGAEEMPPIPTSGAQASSHSDSEYFKDSPPSDTGSSASTASWHMLQLRMDSWAGSTSMGSGDLMQTWSAGGGEQMLSKLWSAGERRLDELEELDELGWERVCSACHLRSVSCDESAEGRLRGDFPPRLAAPAASGER